MSNYLRTLSSERRDGRGKPVSAPDITARSVKSGRATAFYTCPNCCKEILSGSAYCSRCGQLKTGRIYNCIHCGNKLPLSIKFCDSCEK